MNKYANIIFSEEGIKEALGPLIGRHFSYMDQDGSHFVRLEHVTDYGNVTLIDCNERTGKPLSNAVEYTVSLFGDGTLTYL